MKKIGLVLAGGGGKGAYQIGVAKALFEYGIAPHIKAIAGTSVGALNTLLLAQGDIRKAEKVWLTISPEKILTINPSRIMESAKRRLSESWFLRIESIFSKMIGHGWFSREGLLEMIGEHVDLSVVSNIKIPLIATCLHAGSLEAKYFHLDGAEPQRIVDILLASSAIPFVFDPVEIDGEMYWDGGFPLPKADNIPIKPLYDRGCDVIIAVHLSRDSLINHRNFPNAQIIEIVPQDHQGGIFSGTLDFTPSGARRRMDQGYHDAKRILQPILDMMMVQRDIQVKLTEMHHDEKEFKEKRTVLLGERELLKRDIIQYLKR